MRYDSQRGFAGERRRFLPAAGLRLRRAGPRRPGGLRLQGGRPRALPGQRSCARPACPSPSRARAIRNLYTLHLQNKTDAAHRYRIEPAPGAPAGLSFIIPQPELALGPLEDGELPLFATLPRADYTATFDFDLLVTELESGNQRRLALRFRGP